MVPPQRESINQFGNPAAPADHESDAPREDDHLYKEGIIEVSESNEITYYDDMNAHNKYEDDYNDCSVDANDARPSNNAHVKNP